MILSKRVLVIAGSDSGAGAGIQADLKTLAAHGVYGLCAVTAVTAQNSRGVQAVAAVPPAMVAAQIDAVLADGGADAIKIGMLWNAAIVRTVAERLRVHLPAAGAPLAPARSGRAAAGPRRVPVVFDPVLAAGTGAPLTADLAETIAAMLSELLPLVTLVTPNVPELALLTAPGAENAAAPAAAGSAPPAAAGEPERLAQARRLAARGPAVLAKGGHDQGTGGQVVDLLLVPGGAGGQGEQVVRFAAPRLATRATHGTGCTLSAAIAGRLAAGEQLAAAAGGAIGYVRRAMQAAVPAGAGPAPLAHFFDRQQDYRP